MYDYYSDDIYSDVDDFLAHHGVKGMKWGVRRARRSSDREKERAKRQRQKINAKKRALVKEGKWRQVLKNKQLYTDKELEAIAKRINVERSFKNVVTGKSQAQAKAKSETLKKLGTVGRKTLTAVNSALAAYGTYKAVKRIFGDRIIRSNNMNKVYKYKDFLDTNQLTEAIKRAKSYDAISKMRSGSS